MACAIAVVVGTAPPAAGQTLPGAGTVASLDVAVDVNGAGQIDLRLSQTPSDPQAIERALGQALGAPLEEVTRAAHAAGWHLRARCPGAGVRSGLIVEGRLDPDPLAGPLRRAGYGELRVVLSHPSAAFNRCSWGPDDERDELLQVTYREEFDIRGAPPPPVQWTFGYRPQDVARYALLPAILLLPSALILLRRWRARRRAEDDPGAVWYAQWWFHRRLVVLTWAAWIVALLWLGVPSFVIFLAPGVGGAWGPLAVALGACLPLAALGAAKVLAHPLFDVVPEAGWTRAVLIRQAVWGQLAVLLPAAATSAAVAAFLAERRLLGALLVLAAVFAGLIGLGTWALSLGWAKTPLPEGEVRNRVFELAVHAGVHVRQVYVLPAARWRLLNVFAAPGNNVHVADTLLRHLSKREVDALLAHELVYLWRMRLRALWFPFAAIGAVVATSLLAAVALLWVGLPVAGWFAAPVLAGLGVASLRGMGLRRFAPGTDAQAATVTGDAEALITALAKLARLGLVPFHSPRRLRDCPANAIPFERLEKLAEDTDIPPERLDEILRHPATGQDAYTPFGAAADPTAAPPKTFASEFRVSRNALGWANLAVAVVVPGLTAYAAAELAIPGGVRWLLYAAGVALAVGLRCLAARAFALRLTLRLRERALRALAAEGLDAAAAEGVFIGLAPDPCPRVYDGYFDWDVGFLFIGRDVLAYAGERVRFALRRNQVKDIRLGPGHPAWKRYPRIYVEWQDEDGTGGTLNLHPSDVRSWWRSRTPVRELAARLGACRAKAGTASELLAPLAGLPGPRIGPVSSVAPREFIGPGQAVAIAVVEFVLAGLLAAALGLPTDPTHLGAWAYALLVPPALEVATLLPYLRYRDPPTQEHPA
jgi:Zn-dependent protease with chaperone function